MAYRKQRTICTEKSICQIIFYFKETPLGVDNRLRPDFPNNELIYQISFSTKNDYYITIMNFNLVIANHYGRLLENIKTLSTKSRLLLEEGAACQFDLSLVKSASSFPGMKKTQIN